MVSIKMSEKEHKQELITLMDGVMSEIDLIYIYIYIYIYI